VSLLEIRSLDVSLPIQREMRPVLRDVSLSIEPGEAHGLVGESGSGKSMTSRSVMRLLPPGAAVTGEIEFDGVSVLSMRRRELNRYRDSDVAMIFQDPRAHTNPVRTIGDFVVEALRTNRGMSAPAARKRALELLADVLIDDPERRLRQYPHELSGGLLQRVMIAAALSTEPRLLLADEPTTALDVTTQSEVMAILDEQRKERGLALLFVTHDLDLAAAVCDRITVLYAGSVVETQPGSRLGESPLHPYSRALLAARPSVAATGTRQAAIPGRPLSSFEAPDGCAFADRCAFVQDPCREARPELLALRGGLVRCRRAPELLDAGIAGTPVREVDRVGHTR
jgi:oligopeptide/dipeptide ABC transporter ATP-binding protein